MWEVSRLGRQGVDPDQVATVSLLAGHRESGEPVHEETPAVPVESDTWRLLATPGLVEGVAADDVVRVLPDGATELVARGGNVAVKVYTSADETAVRELIARVEEQGGWLDGYVPGRLVVLTFPAAGGFAGIEAALQRFAEAHGDAWHYGNVYDANDEPLGWWIGGE